MPISVDEYVEPHVAAQILRAALLDIRRLCRKGHSDQAAALADAVHNVPTRILSDELRRDRLMSDLLSYQEAYPERNTYDYVEMMNEPVAKNQQPLRL